MNIRQTIRRFIPAALAGILLTPALGHAQGGKASLAVSAVKPLPALADVMAASGKSASLARVVEAYDSQLIDRINAIRKFDIVGRSDLREVLKEQELAASGNVAADDADAAQAGQLAGAKYVLVATIDDFDDTTETMGFTNLNKTALKRKIRLSTTAKFYDATSSRLLESVNILVEKKDDRMDSNQLNTDSELTDALLLEVTRDAAEQIATKMADRIFPVRVLVKRDKRVTVNRGDGGGMEAGQIYDVFALGEDLVDPDTGEVLGREEVRVGTVRVVSVQPRVSSAEVLEDLGIDRGAVLRLAAED